MGQVLVPFGDNQRDTATLLLAAVEEVDGAEAHEIIVDHFEGGFRAPAEVAKKAGLDTIDPDAEREAEVEEARSSETLPSQSVTQEEAEVKQQEALRKESPLPEQPAKKAAAKKATKAPAKKSAAKKSTAKKASN